MTRTQLGSGQIKGVNLASGSDDITGTLPVANGGTGAVTLTGVLKGNGTSAFTAATAGTDYVSPTGAETLTNKTLTDPKSSDLFDTNGNKIFGLAATTSAVNFLFVNNSATGSPVGITAYGADADVGFDISMKGNGALTQEGVPIVTTTASQTLTNKTLTSPSVGGTPVFTTGIPAANLPDGLINGNTSTQSQLVVSATSYYIAGSNLTLPATLKAGMAVGTRFRWRVAMAKTNAGTGAFAIEIRRGTAGTVSDTADVSQSIGTQTAAVDSMVVDVEMVVTTTGATGAYYWTIIPTHQAITATGFGVATGATGQFSGTVSSVAMNTTSLIFGLSFKATTGTPTVTVPLVQAQALNIC